MSQSVEFWTSGICPVDVERQASDAEAMGWDGIVFFDSQNVGGDCYVAMALAARATATLKVGTGVTNPFTRHPAVTASAAATVQEISSGRLTLGIGRGDSANAHLGFAPSSVLALQRYVSLLRRFLARDEVPFEELLDYGFGSRPALVEELHLGDNVSGSRLQWWAPSSQPPPPVDIAATGPKTIAMAAKYADSVALTVGADITRVKWATEIARESGDVPIGAYVNVACHPDKDVAFDLVRGPLAAFARFSVMHGNPMGPMSEDQRSTLTRIAASYDMAQHGKSGSTGTAINEEFARQFAIIGSPEQCIERIRQLADTGISRFVFPRLDPATPFHLSSKDAQLAQTYLSQEVIPGLR